MSIVQIANMSSKRYALPVLFFCGCSMAVAQTKVTGRVLDDIGEPVIGASVLEKGTTNGTVTDIDGNFSLNVANGKTIVISFVGYASQEIIANGKTITVTLQNNDQILDETIVVGYGSVKKSNLTSAVSKIGTGALEDRALTSVGDAFQGQLAGVQSQAADGGLPGQEMTIRIRGVNSITGSTDPLYVIDGVPRDNMSDINPSDIESVQILKDASATSIYGSRGANGVVLIQTKTGKGKPTVTFNAYYGVQKAEKTLELESGEEYVALNMMRRNWEWNRAYPTQKSASQTERAAKDASKAIPLGSTNGAPIDWSTYTDFTDWQSRVLRTAPIQNYEASASSSGDMGSIFFSLGYQNQEGIILNTDYKRLNMRLNAELNIMENLRVGMNMAYSNSKQNAGTVSNGADRKGKESPMHHATMVSPLVKPGQAVYPAGTPSQQYYGSSYIDPELRLENNTDLSTVNRAQASIYGEWDIIKGLRFKSQYSRTFDGTQYEYFSPDWVNRSAYKNEGFSFNKHYQDWTIQNTLTYDVKIGETQHLNVLLGQSAEKEEYYYAYLKATGWAYNNLITLNLASTATDASTKRTAYTNASFFGRVQYDYAEKYLATVSVRRDGSSRFGSNTKWGTFPSGSLGWKISSEDFLADQEWLNLLKLRASYGLSGNDRIGDYAYTAQLGSYNSAIGNTTTAGAAASNIANPDLKWEQTASLDLGFDFSAWHNRVQFNFDWYRNRTKDLLYYVQTPNTTGFSSYLTNLGEIENKGWEIDVTGHAIAKKDFKWDVALNLSRNRNEVIDLGGEEYYQPAAANGQIFRSYVGGPVSQYYVYRTDGVLTADDMNNPNVVKHEKAVEGNPKYLDMNGDKKINEADMVAYGNNLPDLTYGLTNTFTYKNWTLSVLIQGQFGGDILYLGARHNDEGDCYKRTIFSRWTRMYKTEAMKEAMEEPTLKAYLAKTGVDMSWDGETPNVWEGWYTGNDDRRIYDATYMRIKNINLSYQFDKNLLKKAHISSLKVYGSIDNVYTFTDYRGYTPEASSYGDGLAQMGVDYSTYPLSRKFTLGVNLTF